MKQENIIRRGLMYLNDQSVDIRIRMMFFLEYASLIACLVGTIFMVLLKQPFYAMLPNIILLVMSFAGLFFSQFKKKYELSALIMIIGCANIAVPWMFFSAGGNDSGMHIWLLFSVVVTCLLASGKMRILMVSATIIEDLACICIGHYYPDSVSPLVGEDAVFFDEVQSYAVVCICLTIMLIIYVATYDNQRYKLEQQSLEMRNIMQTDALTGLYNRHAYYEEISNYDNSSQADDLVLVAMDVNGLKKVNDSLGHAAGDEYLQEAAKVINNALGQYGHIFRTGGDEFMAILRCSVDDAGCLEQRINDCILSQDNKWPEKMAIAVGIVCCKDNPDVLISEIEKIADTKMYNNKAEYYRKKGVDRRR